MYPHGDSIISGVENKVEDKPSSYSGPVCGYTVREKKGDVTTTKKCGSQEVVWDVSGTGTRGFSKRTPVCGPHYEKAFREWNVDRAEKINSAPKD